MSLHFNFIFLTFAPEHRSLRLLRLNVTCACADRLCGVVLVRRRAGLAPLQLLLRRLMCQSEAHQVDYERKRRAKLLKPARALSVLHGIPYSEDHAEDEDEDGSEDGSDEDMSGKVDKQNVPARRGSTSGTGARLTGDGASAAQNATQHRTEEEERPGSDWRDNEEEDEEEDEEEEEEEDDGGDDDDDDNDQQMR